MKKSKHEPYKILETLDKEKSYPLIPSFMILKNDTSLYKEILSKIAFIWNIHTDLHSNPGANPISLEQCNLYKLKHNAVTYVAHKSNGIRYQLLLFKSVMDGK